MVRWGIVGAAAGVLSCGFILTGCSNRGPGPEVSETKLRAAALSAGHPVYYLGPTYEDLPLDDYVVDPQQVSAQYGSCTPGFDSSCSPRLQVDTAEIDLSAWSAAVGCARLADLRGVPAVHFGDALSLLTAELVVSIAFVPDDIDTARAAAGSLRPVGESEPDGGLPPPSAGVMRVVDRACGAKPGEHGPWDSEFAPPPTDAAGRASDTALRHPAALS